MVSASVYLLNATARRNFVLGDIIAVNQPKLQYFYELGWVFMTVYDYKKISCIPTTAKSLRGTEYLEEPHHPTTNKADRQDCEVCVCVCVT